MGERCALNAPGQASGSGLESSPSPSHGSMGTGTSQSLGPSDRELIERALLDELERQNPDMQQDPDRDTVWLSGGATPQTCGTFINVHDLAEAVQAALASRPAVAEGEKMRDALANMVRWFGPWAGKTANQDAALDAAVALLSAAPKP